MSRAEVLAALRKARADYDQVLMEAGDVFAKAMLEAFVGAGSLVDEADFVAEVGGMLEGFEHEPALGGEAYPGGLDLPLEVH